MFRKFTFTLCAAAALAAAALMPTTASARHGSHGARSGGHYHGGHVARVGHYRPYARAYVGHRAYVARRAYVGHRAYVRHYVRPYYARRAYYVRRPYYARPLRYARGYACVVRRVVATPYGPRVRLINRCRPPVVVVHRRYY